jgi:hypothetical protein
MVDDAAVPVRLRRDNYLVRDRKLSKRFSEVLSDQQSRSSAIAARGHRFFRPIGTH